MTKKTTAIFAYVGYFCWIFWIIGFFAGDKEGAKYDLNQGLVLILASIAVGVVGGIISLIPVVGAIVYCAAGIALTVFAIMGIVAACKEEEKPLPLIGKIQLLK